MSRNSGVSPQIAGLSPDELRIQLAVHAKNLLQIRLSQVSAKRRGSALQERRQIARLLTLLRSIDT